MKSKLSLKSAAEFMDLPEYLLRGLWTIFHIDKSNKTKRVQFHQDQYLQATPTALSTFADGTGTSGSERNKYSI
jgi:hypothetical protein